MAVVIPVTHFDHTCSDGAQARLLTEARLPRQTRHLARFRHGPAQFCASAAGASGVPHRSFPSNSSAPRAPPLPARYIDRGVDHISTDVSALAVRLRAERAALYTPNRHQDLSARSVACGVVWQIRSAGVALLIQQVDYGGDDAFSSLMIVVECGLERGHITCLPMSGKY